jgi:hypothetical protein
MPRLIFCLLCSGLLFISCEHYRTIGNTVRAEGPRPLYENKKLGLTVNLYGDYLVHSFNHRQMLNWNKEFAGRLGKGCSRPRLLLAAHTTVEPFCSTVFLVYSHADSSTFVAIRRQLETKPAATNLEVNDELVGIERCRVMRYEFRDPKLKTEAHYIELLCLNGSKLLRACFWSMDTNTEWLGKEARGIVETLRWTTNPAY